MTEPYRTRDEVRIENATLRVEKAAVQTSAWVHADETGSSAGPADQRMLHHDTLR